MIYLSGGLSMPLPKSKSLNIASDISSNSFVLRASIAQGNNVKSISLALLKPNITESLHEFNYDGEVIETKKVTATIDSVELTCEERKDKITKCTSNIDEVTSEIRTLSQKVQDAKLTITNKEETGTAGKQNYKVYNFDDAMINM